MIPIIQQMGVESVEALKDIKPGKLHGDICGMRKKLKLDDVVNPTIEEVKGWFEN